MATSEKLPACSEWNPVPHHPNEDQLLVRVEILAETVQHAVLRVPLSTKAFRTFRVQNIKQELIEFRNLADKTQFSEAQNLLQV
jgi:hypothetical protein